MFVVAR